MGQRKEFEGTIEFSTKEVAKDTLAGTGAYTSTFGTSYTTYLKKGSYKQVLEHGTLEWIMYDKYANRYCFKAHDRDTIYFLDCSKETGRSAIGRIDAQATILGYKCRAIEMKDEEGTQTVFYSPKLRMSKKYFTRHKCMSFDLMSEYCNAPYLKIIAETGSSTIITEAKKVTRKKLDDNIFALPDLPYKQLN
ncbi:hypothetical protein GCM10023093_09530 [Nemorincola caseinilytica]|uniref:DUF4412 domain-containing protein n=2 Tax=Nemorincola caseinilytica TaxID=2054315 RepID=A0ABP8NAD4_9BACT